MKKFNTRRSTSRIRCSSHKLHIETGRYINTDRQARVCFFCRNTSNLSVIESEDHILNSCYNGANIRQVYHSSIRKVAEDTLSILQLNINSNFNIARTFPEELDNINSREVLQSRSKVINKSCDTIHHLYCNTLYYNKDVLQQGNPTRG